MLIEIQILSPRPAKCQLASDSANLFIVDHGRNSDPNKIERKVQKSPCAHHPTSVTITYAPLVPATPPPNSASRLQLVVKKISYIVSSISIVVMCLLSSEKNSLQHSLRSGVPIESSTIRSSKTPFQVPVVLRMYPFGDVTVQWRSFKVTWKRYPPRSCFHSIRSCPFMSSWNFLNVNLILFYNYVQYLLSFKAKFINRTRDGLGNQGTEDTEFKGMWPCLGHGDAPPKVCSCPSLSSGPGILREV